MRSRKNWVAVGLLLVFGLAICLLTAGWANHPIGWLAGLFGLGSGRVPRGIRVVRDIEYARPDNKPQLLDLYIPEKAEGNLPLIVWIHGGWFGGDKGNPWAVRMAPRGYVVASINYRLGAEAIFPAQIEDCKAAIRWLRANAEKYHIAGDRIGVWGASAGGHLAALLGASGGVKELEGTEGDLTVSSRVQAVCDFSGPTDFTKMSAFPSAVDHDATDSAEAKLIGGPVQQNREKAARANPITYVAKDNPPFLIVHGDKDPMVPYNQSELLHAALKKAGVDVTFLTVVGGGHDIGGGKEDTMVEAFFDRVLKGKK